MKINLICVGKKLPRWVNDVVEDYTKRFSQPDYLRLIEVPALKRTGALTIEQINEKEGKNLVEHIPSNSLIIALDVKGKMWNSQQLADVLLQSTFTHSSLSFLIGGPNGLSQACLDIAQHKWSLSALTFPHPLARVIVSEALYRAYSITQSHPYHK